jgi:hypothetical protein
MSQSADKTLHVTEVLRTKPIEWPKHGTLHSLLRKLTGAETEGDAGLEVVYEDDHVVAFHEIDPDDGEAHKWSVRVTVAPKHHRTTLLDLGIVDDKLSAALLNGVQQAALKLGLHETGFEMYAGVLPPFQRNAYLTLQIRAGKHSESPAAPPTPSA